MRAFLIVVALACLAVHLLIALVMAACVVASWRESLARRFRLRRVPTRPEGQVREASRSAEGDAPPASSAAHLRAPLFLVGGTLIPTPHPKATENP